MREVPEKVWGIDNESTNEQMQPWIQVNSKMKRRKGGRYEVNKMNETRLHTKTTLDRRSRTDQNKQNNPVSTTPHNDQWIWSKHKEVASEALGTEFRRNCGTRKATKRDRINEALNPKSWSCWEKQCVMQYSGFSEWIERPWMGIYRILIPTHLNK